LTRFNWEAANEWWQFCGVEPPTLNQVWQLSVSSWFKTCRVLAVTQTLPQREMLKGSQGVECLGISDPPHVARCSGSVGYL